jgi:hypothetical protein
MAARRLVAEYAGVPSSRHLGLEHWERFAPGSAAAKAQRLRRALMRLRMRREEMAQRHEKPARVLPVAACQSCTNFVSENAPDLLRTMLLTKQVLCKGCRCDRGNMLVLGNGQYFFLRQAAHGDAVFERDHNFPQPIMPCCNQFAPRLLRYQRPRIQLQPERDKRTRPTYA